MKKSKDFSINRIRKNLMRRLKQASDYIRQWPIEKQLAARRLVNVISQMGKVQVNIKRTLKIRNKKGGWALNKYDWKHNSRGRIHENVQVELYSSTFGNWQCVARIDNIVEKIYSCEDNLYNARNLFRNRVIEKLKNLVKELEEITDE